MRLEMRILAITLAAGLLLAAVTTGCDWFPKRPTPTPTPPASIPVEVLAARDAALAYLRHAYGNKAPPEGASWTARNTTPQALVGSASYAFTSGKWQMTVRVPVVAPGKVLYEMELDNEETGFRWTGRLSANYTVLESNLDVAAEVLIVRETILSYVREHYPDRAAGENLVWVGERTTQEGSMGHESCRFNATDWVMTVDYDLTQPDQMVYVVELRNLSSGFVWRGQIDAQGTVLEQQPR